ncbi:MAG: phosphoglycolate phosphatase [Acidobacteriota bacterium]|nr:MAG: phosphoglycolate phosphatase [Acidobacteriota bacterium]
MPDVKLVIFDLDGTLVDSAEDIAHAVNEMREQFALAPLPLDEIESYIGNGVRKLLERALPGFEREIVEAAHEIYLPIYRRRLLDNTRAYPGVVPALEELDVLGYTLSVLTNKPLNESMMILEGLGLRQHFAQVYGGDSFEHKKPDPTGLRRLLEEADAGTHETLFVGDSSVDLETARNASVRCCLVTYGIRPETVASLEPDFRIDDLRDLVSLMD